MSDTCVLFFVKYPDPGTVKTRLGEVLGHENAAALYRHFVQDLMLELGRVQADLRVMHAPGDDVTARRFKEWLGPQHRYLPQVGSDLGVRMRHAFDEAFAAGYERVVLMGSDVPDYPHELVQKALDDLHQHDVVIGPANDGGYYLIGFRRDTYRPDVFEGIAWSTPEVFEVTRERLQEARCDTLRLPDWNDVDTMWDLNVLYRNNRNSSFRLTASYAALREHDELLRRYDIDLPRVDRSSREAAG